MPTFYYAWVAEGTAFNAATHATLANKPTDGSTGTGENILGIEIAQVEGEFATLSLEVKNPKVGLLAAGRNQWAWLSWDNGSGVEALFNGRLIGIPQNMTGEVVRLQFVARPADFVAQKEAAAAALKVLPYHDPVWLAERVDEPDTVLETRAARWHINRTTLVVSTSSIAEGEDGTITVTADQHFYDGFEASYGEAPLKKVKVTGTVSWTQQGAGEVDLTRAIWQKFKDAGSPYDYPIIASMTGSGLFSTWPDANRNIGGGWSFGASALIEEATWIEEKAYVVEWADLEDDAKTSYQEPTMSMTAAAGSEGIWANWRAAFPLGRYKINVPLTWTASRARSETVTATIEADVQPLLVDPGAAEEELIELASDLVGEPVDESLASPGTYDRPLDDLKRNSYFKTDRGAQSFEYLLLLARARLLQRARAVQISFVTTWTVAVPISCRHSVRIVDDRLPGGEATGKVTSYALVASGDGEFTARVTIGCMIGYGVSLDSPAAGTGDYVEDGYVEDGWQSRTGAETELIAGELQYQSFDDFEVTDDDGVDLQNMTADTAVNSITVTDGPTAQVAAIDAALALSSPDPVGALNESPTIVALDLVPVEGGAFHVEFTPTVSDLVIQQGVDLEASP